MFEKYIDYNLEIENAILGAALLEKNVINILVALPMKPEYFYSDSNKIIMQNLIEMHSKKIPIDILTCVDFLSKKNIRNLGSDSMPYYVTRLTNFVVSSANIIYHCAVVGELYDKRQLKILASKAASGANITTLKKIINKVETKRCFSIKEARYLLTYIDKPLIKKTASKFGQKTIPGKDRHKIQVENLFLVYLMSIIEPYFTWTVNSGDEVFSKEQVRSSIKKGAKLFEGSNGETYWGDPIYKYPIELNL